MLLSYIIFFLPDIVLSFFLLFSFLVSLCKIKKDSYVLNSVLYVFPIIICFVTSVYCLCYAIFVCEDYDFSMNIFHNLYHQNYLSYVIKCIILFIISFVLICSYEESKYLSSKEWCCEYVFFLFMLFFGSFVLLSSSLSLISAYIGIEVQALSSYALLAFPRGNFASSRTSIYYFILNSVASFFLLLGFIMLLTRYGFDFSFSHAGNKQYADMHNAFSYTLITVSILFKLGVAPMHSWVNMVYRSSLPSFIMYTASISKISILSYFFIIFPYHTLSIYPVFFNFFSRDVLRFCLVLLCFFIGTFTAYRQKNIFSLLAYSSIASLGYVLCTLTNVVSLFFVISYSIIVIGFIFALMSVRYNGKVLTLFEDFHNLFKKYPFLVIVMTLYIVSFIGIPPFLGFFAKFYIIYSIININYNPTIVILFTLLMSFYYLNFLQKIWFSDNNKSCSLYTFHFFPFIISCIVLILSIFVGFFSVYFIYSGSIHGLYKIAEIVPHLTYD